MDGSSNYSYADREIERTTEGGSTGLTSLNLKSHRACATASNTPAEMLDLGLKLKAELDSVIMPVCLPETNMGLGNGHICNHPMKAHMLNEKAVFFQDHMREFGFKPSELTFKITWWENQNVKTFSQMETI